MNKQQLTALAMTLPFGSVVCASGAMMLHGLWPESSDLDAMVTDNGFLELAARDGAVMRRKPFGDNVLIGDMEASRMEGCAVRIEGTEIEGVMVQTIESLFQFYCLLNRQKDQEKLRILRALL